MNYLIVRTRLHAIIALKLIDDGHLPTPFTLIELYQFNKREDAPGVYKYYRYLAKYACRTKHIIQADGIWKTTIELFLACCHAKLTGGRFYVAVIDLYPLAIALRLIPGFSLVTFDDGRENIKSKTSVYHSMESLSSNSLKGKIARLVFPKGASYFNRARISKHFTIYPQKDNVVPPNKCFPIQLNWDEHFQLEDKLKLPNNVQKILLGTVYEGFGDTEFTDRLIKIRDKILQECDLYIPHPREKLTFESPKIFNLTSPAESLIEHLVRKNVLVVYHFNSSGILNLVENQRLKIIDLGKSMSSIEL